MRDFFSPWILYIDKVVYFIHNNYTSYKELTLMFMESNVNDNLIHSFYFTEFLSLIKVPLRN